MGEEEIDLLMQNTSLIHHRAKLEAIIKNAKAYITMQQNGEDFQSVYLVFCELSAAN